MSCHFTIIEICIPTPIQPDLIETLLLYWIFFFNFVTHDIVFTVF